MKESKERKDRSKGGIVIIDTQTIYERLVSNIFFNKINGMF